MDKVLVVSCSGCGSDVAACVAMPGAELFIADMVIAAAERNMDLSLRMLREEKVSVRECKCEEE